MGSCSRRRATPIAQRDYGALFPGQVQTELGVGNHLILDDPRLLVSADEV
jgi:hypothetical protein